MKNLLGFLSILAAMGVSSSSMAHVDLIAMNAERHSQMHRIETLFVFLMLGAIVYFWYRRQKDGS